MERVKRQPTKFGALDFADEIGQELNVPLNRIGEKFSLDEATRMALENSTLMSGRRAEKMFQHVVASLGKAELITPEDATAPLYSGPPVQAPDYYVALKSSKRYFVEVKHVSTDNLDKPLTLGKNYLSRLKRYAYLKGHPLLIAVYWRAVGIWTANKVEDIETKNGTVNLRFVDAMQLSCMGEFGDRAVGVVPPLKCRVHANPNHSSSLENENTAHFVIGNLTFYSEGKEIKNEVEKQYAFYLIFHSRWPDADPTVHMDGDRVDYVEFVANPEERFEQQEFEIIGSTAGMISSHYEWLTTADSNIVRLTPSLSPAEMAPGFDDSYKGEELRLWQFESVPNYDSLKQGH